MEVKCVLIIIMPCDGFAFPCTAECIRKAFVDKNYHGKLSLNKPKHVEINRSTIFEDVITLYSTMPEVVNQIPIRVKFQGEEGVDFGGVGRDFFPAFWEQAYKIMFDGAALLTPVSHADVALDRFAVLGKVLSHGYLCCGFIPTRIVYPILVYVLLGLSVDIPESTFVQCFSDFLSIVDRKTIADAIKVGDKEFTQDVKSSVINIISRFGCRDIPTPDNLKRILSSLAQHQFKSRPFAAITTMNSAIPEKHNVLHWQPALQNY